MDDGMLVYDYQCKTCQMKFELKKAFGDNGRAECPKCKEDAQRLFWSVPIVFKGVATSQAIDYNIAILKLSKIQGPWIRSLGRSKFHNSFSYKERCLESIAQNYCHRLFCIAILSSMVAKGT